MPDKSPLVFLDYDQAALDAAYDQAAYAPNREQLIRRRASDSLATRARIGAPERVAYGMAEIEKLDIYRAARDRAPILVFIHGGAWRGGRRRGVRGTGRDARRRRSALRGAGFQLGAGCRAAA